MIDIKIPTVGESILEVELVKWFVSDGEFVKKNQEIAEIESDKATLTITAPDNGNIKIIINEGSTIAVGSIAAEIEPSKSSTPSAKQQEKKLLVNEKHPITKETQNKLLGKTKNKTIKITPLAKKKMQEKKLNIQDVLNGVKRISSKDIDTITFSASTATRQTFSRETTKTKISQLRQKISQQLVAVKNETAMLTTFNEVDMSTIIGLRKKYQPTFIEKHQIKLGFMSFFAKAVSIALKVYPNINSIIEKKEIISYKYVDLSIAVQTPKGLMVPVIRNVESLSLAEIEQQLSKLAKKAREAKISIDEMTGGTFTITNGGVYGSMLSTPIINPPQSAILGMHNIIQRPIVINDKIVIKPMMYLALSYDHRIIDGKDAVEFLLKVKHFIEKPTEMLFGGKKAENLLLEL